MKNFYSYFILIAMIFGQVKILTAQCFSSGPRNGTSFTNNSATGTIAWVAPSNVITSNSVPSSASVVVAEGDTVTTHYLFVRNFGFNIPANAVICGISVVLERKEQGAGTNSQVYDNSVYLLNNGGISGTNHAFPWGWTNNYSNTVHGGISDIWGGSWTAADINSPLFGVAVSTNLKSVVGSQFLSADMDHVSIQVFYTIPLPILLVDFQAKVDKNREVNISWSTAAEINNDFFTIERSQNGIQWEKVDQLDGAGSSNSNINYSVTDHYPGFGDLYYRLKQTDLNGDFSYSEIEHVYIDQTSDIVIRYQAMDASVLVNAYEGNSLSLCIYDYSGRVVKNDFFEETDSISVSIGELDPGIYIFVVISDQQKLVQKLYLN